ncbi:uncharacterized protein [Primulina huaijiensis]|uniref:uncharacterized protein isoform X2 n=1 Tax=Primulina huaijiensis TaxID=1492673 RepID=UPI003CC6FE3F
MPSGSKKRKAARKKKENQSLSNHSNGDDDVKQQDDKDSDVGELSSPTSHDHNSHQNNLLTEGDEEQNEKGDNISHTPSEEVLKIKDSEEPSIVEDDVVPVYREFEIEDKSSKKADGSSSGSSSSSSSRNSSRSNSDDESHRIKKGEAAIDITPVVELESGDGSLSGVPAENIVNAEIDDGVDSVVENFPAEELKNISTLGDKLETDISIAPYISEPTESEEERPGFVEDNGISTVFVDAPVKRKDESIETIVIPVPKKCVTQETHDRVAADVGVELEKDSGVTEVLVLAPAPHPVQTATWKSCCGLFDVFARCGR